MTDKEVLKEYLSKVKHMVVAVTLDDGTPWAVPVRIQRHEGKQFEWDSSYKTVHSQAIAKKSTVAIVIFSIDSDIGFYAKATTEELLGSRNDEGYARYRATVTESWINEKRTKRPITI